MKTADYARMSASEIAHRVRAREFSAREIATAALDALDAAEPRVHAFATVARDQALAAADALDARLARGEAVEPLAGAPIAITAQNRAIANIQPLTFVMGFPHSTKLRVGWQIAGGMRCTSAPNDSIISSGSRSVNHHPRSPFLCDPPCPLW